MTNSETVEHAAEGDVFTRAVAVDGTAVAIRIVQARALSYKVPANGPIRSNYVIVLNATDETGRTIEGIGEGQPRGKLTGDAAEPSWDFLQTVLERLYDMELSLGDSSISLNEIRTRMKEFTAFAAEHSADPENKRPYRGTLSGIEAALLDLIGNATGLPLYEILGQVRESAPLIAPSVRMNQTPNRLRLTLNQQKDKYETVRVSGSRKVARTADFLDLVSLIASSRRVGQGDKPIWIEMGGLLDREDATSFVTELADSMGRGRLPSRVYVEQPVPMRYADHLAVLQKRADELLEQIEGDFELVIVGDESIWDIHSFGRLKKIGGIRAVTIRPAQAGGLLPSLELAEAVRAYEPEAKVNLSRMPGASRITQSAIKHLALALPQIDGVSTSTFDHNRLPFVHRNNSVNGMGWVERQSWEERHPHTDVEEVDSADGGSVPDVSDERIVGATLQSSEDGDDHEPAGADNGPDDSMEEPAERGAKGVRTTTARTAPGLGLRISYGPLVSEARRFATVPELAEPMNEGRSPARYDHVDDVRPLGPNGTKGFLLEKRALARGLSTTRYSKSAFVAFDGKNPAVNFKWSRNPVSSAVAMSICTHKEATRLVLEDAGVPTPQGRTFRNGDFDSARAFVRLIGFPVVVKPSMGIRGIGVIAGIDDDHQLEDAFRLMADSKFGGQDFIVEKHINGRDHRILVVGGEVVAAIQRKPASVYGDGRSSIAEILIHRNVARRANPHLWTRPAKFDGTMAHQLEKLGLSLDTVLPVGQEVMLSNTANISQGADSIDVFDTLHPSIIDACKRAVAAVPDMQYCGVDFLLEDPSKPVDEQAAAIIELNAHAAIGNCEYPMFGTGRQVARRLMDLVIEKKDLQVVDPQEVLTVHMTIRGKVTRVGFRKWLQSRATKMSAAGWVRNLNRRTIEAVIHGPIDRIAPLIAACIIGPSGALPTSYNATVIPLDEAELGPEGDFDIRRRPEPEELSEAEECEIEQLAQAEQE